MADTYSIDTFLWGMKLGTIWSKSDRPYTNFTYSKEYLGSGYNIAPLTMPPNSSVHTFPTLSPLAFDYLPGLFDDSLPDKFGTIVLKAFCRTQGLELEQLPIPSRLAYIGNRGLGAIEYASETEFTTGPWQIHQYVKVISALLRGHDDKHPLDSNMLLPLMASCIYAGGARAKALAYYDQGHDAFSFHQFSGMEPWLVKFDGVSRNQEHGIAHPQGFGAIEYAYSLMAKDAGIIMAPTKLIEEGGRKHFASKRFDRNGNDKLHMQTLMGLAHYDYSQPGKHSYEDVFKVFEELGLTDEDFHQQYLRLVFNVIARNQDDHVKNISFLYGPDGHWKLSPGYDITFAYDPNNYWMAYHQMTINNKRENITRADLLKIAGRAGLSQDEAQAVIDKVANVVSNWTAYAQTAGVSEVQTTKISRQLLTI